MRTQKHDLKDEIKRLEYALYRAEQDQDAITVLSIIKRLDDAKSTLINIQVMGTNFSQETAQTKFDEYTYRIEALCNRIEELKAQIEVSQIFKQNG